MQPSSLESFLSGLLCYSRSNRKTNESSTNDIVNVLKRKDLENREEVLPEIDRLKKELDKEAKSI